MAQSSIKPMNKKAVAILNSNAKVQVFAGGVRSMKSFAGTLKGAIISAQTRGTVGADVAPTYTMVRDVLIPQWRFVLSVMGMIPGRDYKYNKSEYTFEFANGSRVYMRSGDKAERLYGLTLDWFRMDEASTQKKAVYDTLIDRIAVPNVLERGFGLLTSTPTGTNWFYDVFNRAESDPDYHSETIYTAEAGLVPRSEVEFARKHTDARYFRQQYMASFETWAGLVYDAFSKENVRRCEYNPGLPVYVGLDFGWTDPCVAIWMQYDKHTGTYYVLDEFVQPRVMGESFAKMLAGHEISVAGQDYTPPFKADQITEYITGHEVSQSTQAAGGSSMRNILENYGVPWHKIEYKMHRMFPSMQSVRAAICGADGERRLFIDPKCKRTIADFRGYHYKEVDGEPVGEVPDDSKEGHRYSHTMDSLRYAINTLTPIEPQYGWVS